MHSALRSDQLVLDKSESRDIGLKFGHGYRLIEGIWTPLLALVGKLTNMHRHDLSFHTAQKRSLVKKEIQLQLVILQMNHVVDDDVSKTHYLKYLRSVLDWTSKIAWCPSAGIATTVGHDFGLHYTLYLNLCHKIVLGLQISDSATVSIMR